MAKWTVAEAKSDAVSKRMLLEHLQSNAENAWLDQRKLVGQPTAVLKRVTKDALVQAYEELSSGSGGEAAAPSGSFKFAASPPSGGASGGTFKFEAPPSGGSAGSPAFAFSAPQEASARADPFAFNFSSAAGTPIAGDAVALEASDALQKDKAQRDLSAAQRRDATLAGLPAAVRGRVEALEKLQEESDAVQRDFDAKLAALRMECEQKKAPLFKSRAEAVGGDGVPDFWLTCLRNHMMLSEEIQKADEPVLKHLQDIKCSSTLGPGKPGFQLAFLFGPNPHFENETLTKTYLLDPTDEDEVLDCALGTDIKWKEGMDVTVRMVEKRQKKKGKVRTITVEEPTDSFFNFFDPPEIPEDDEEMEEEEAEQLHEQLENDYDMGCAIKDKIIPRAVAWFTGAAIDPDEDYDDDEEEGEEDDFESDEEEDESDEEDEESEDDDDHVDTSKIKRGQGRGAPAEGQQECKQQ
mmetsp:Transcript_22897/g.68204  ORF Transcript_22897/g.68204 Transcript_22897/m.68204 type:complete len:466 (+) Transcript_22897:27-1424(+)